MQELQKERDTFEVALGSAAADLVKAQSKLTTERQSFDRTREALKARIADLEGQKAAVEHEMASLSRPFSTQERDSIRQQVTALRPRVSGA